MTCPDCSGPGPCDCWKGRLRPAEREAAQDVLLAAWFARRDRRAFEARVHAQLTKRGGFGNRNATRREGTHDQ